MAQHQENYSKKVLDFKADINAEIANHLKSNFNSTTILRNKEELLKIFNNLVKDKPTIVFSCGSGITACILALAASHCNYNNLIVYDGSWTEYGSLTDN